jgi:streptomycin 6-kinase
MQGLGITVMSSQSRSLRQRETTLAGRLPWLSMMTMPFCLNAQQAVAPLVDMSSHGKDDEASLIICGVVAGLHAPRHSPPPELIPLTDWFRALEPMASREGGILVRSAATARTLLANPREVVPLHGDVHHGNILDFEARGWLAIDPKRLEGERGFDYANLFCNPNHPVATAPDRLARQANVVAEAAGLERKRLLQ